MSVPETESAQAAERAAAAPGKADPSNDPRLPWQGKPRAADIFCWLGIVLSGVFYWALLPLRVLYCAVQVLPWHRCGQTSGSAHWRPSSQGPGVHGK